MSQPTPARHSRNHYAATLASTVTAIAVGHPWDTVSKRLQVHTGTMNFPFLKSCLRQPYAGIGWAAGYKAIQWGGKLAAFKPVKSTLSHYAGPPLSECLGRSQGQYALAMMSGALVGTMEACVVLPYDSMKVLKQTNPNMIKGGSWHFFVNNYFSLYRGLAATIARNAPGSALLLGGADVGRQWVQKSNPDKKMSVADNVKVSTLASLASIVGTYPVDLIKTRMQSSFGATATLRETFFSIASQEGLKGFWRGIAPKAASTVPKLSLQMAVFQKVQDMLEEKSSDKSFMSKEGLDCSTHKSP